MHFTKGVHQMSNKFSEDVIQALRAGGFVCLLPNVINPAWGGHAIRLAGFPITICFTGLSPKSERGCQLAVTSCYKFDPSTYLENADVRTMTYVSDPRSEYRVELVYGKRESLWKGRKLCGEKILHTASGTEMRQFIIQLTMLGLEVDEPIRELRTLEDTGSAGIYVFNPEPQA
jgi:hypothetical protein